MLIDSNIWFAIWRGNAALKAWVEALPLAVVDTTIYIECIQGQKSNAEKRVIKKYLNSFSFAPLTTATAAVALQLIDTYSNTHNLLLADALIAANALAQNLPVATYNYGDFHFIAGLAVAVPPMPQ